jgi:hypothetical protein
MESSRGTNEPERRGAALIGELLVLLGGRDQFRAKLAALEERLGPSMLSRVVEEVERLVDRLAKEAEASAPKAQATPPAPSFKPPRDPFADLLADLHFDAPVVTPRTPPVSPPVPSSSGETKTSRPAKEPESTPVPPPAKASDASPPAPPSLEASEAKSLPPTVSQRAPLPRKEPEKPASPPAPPPPTVSEAPPRSASSSKESTKPAPASAPPPPGKPDIAKGSGEPPRASPPSPPVVKEVKAPEEAPAPSQELPKAERKPFTLHDDDIFYFHAVAQIPLEEKPSPVPFLMEERGMESREPVFALDRAGLRFYLSRINGRSTNVSKTGMLLLNKKESLHLRGTHFGILNDLRIHGVLLPFEFGTVAIGTEEMHAKIDEHAYDLRDALEEVLGTKWWEVNVMALDERMASMVAPEGSSPSARERERRGGAERQASSARRIDIKMLERVLNKQKTIAEEIHDKLEGLAERSDVDMMVSLSSGSSDDWKPILRASYEVPSEKILEFSHAITDLQYTHLKYQILFTLKGEREDFSFLQS